MYDERVKGYCNLDTDIEMERPLDGSLCMVDVRLTPLTNPSAEKAPSPVASGTVMANPGPMALYAFGFTTLILMLVEVKLVEGDSVNLVVGYAMFHGGLVQLVVGFIEIYRNNLFGATAFASYGAFWMGWGLSAILEATGLIASEPFPTAKAGYLAIWGIFTSLLFVQTLFINFCLMAIFFLLALTFFLLSAGVFYPSCVLAGGISGIILAIVVFYTATAELLNDFGNVKLPLFHVNSARAEFGNAQAGRGEILTSADPAGLVPLRARTFEGVPSINVRPATEQEKGKGGDLEEVCMTMSQ